MAFREKYINEIVGPVLVLSALLSTASAVDCFGKSFHCFNSTHFMICVDLGGGVSQSIDDFLIPCPPPTVCQGNNHFECEFPTVTTPSTTLSNVISETTKPWEDIVVTTNTPQRNTSATKEYSEKYMDTVSITTVIQDNLTTDTTVIGSVTEASSSNDVNGYLNTTEIVPTSAVNDAITRLDGISETIPDNIVTIAAQIITDLPQVIPVHHLKNYTNETSTDYATLSFSVTESTIMLNHNGLASNDSVGQVKNITAASQTDNVTSKNILDNSATPDMLLVDSDNSTEQPLTTITDESFVTGVNLEAKTAQTLVSADGLQNFVNLNIQTTTLEPATVKNTVGVTDSDQNFTTEQPTVFIPNVENVPTQQPITTTQSTVTEYITTSVNLKNEVIGDTTVGSEQSPTTIYEEKFSTAGYSVYTTEALLIITTNGKQDKQNINESYKVPMKVTDGTNGYMGAQQPTININNLPTIADVNTEQPIAFTMEIQNLSRTKPPNTNIDSLATEAVEKSTDAGIELLIPSTNRSTTGNDATLEPSVLPKKTQKKIEKSDKQLNSSTSSLATDVVNITENPIDITTETEKRLGTESLIINKPTSANGDDMATEASVLLTEPQKPIHLNTSANSVAADNNSITENPSQFNTKTHSQPVTEQPTINNNSPVTGNDVSTEASILAIEDLKTVQDGVEKPRISTTIHPTENPSAFTTQKPINMNTERPTTTKNELVIVTDDVTEKASVSATGTHELTKPIIEEENQISVVTEQPTTNKNLATDNDAIFEIASVTIVENPSGFTTKTPNHLKTEPLMVNENSTDTSIDAATDARVLPTESQKSIYTSTEQSITTKKSLAIDNKSITENPSEVTTKTHKPPVTEQAKINDNSPATGSDVSTEASILATEDLKTVQNAVEEPKMSTKSYSTENHSASTTQKSINMNTERLNATKNELVTDIDVATEKASVPATGTHELTKPIIEEKNVILVVTEQPTTNKNLATDNDAIAEIASVTIVENPSGFTTKTPNHLVTEPLTVIENSSVTSIDATADGRVLSTEFQNSIYTSTDKSIISTKSLAIDNNSITENPSEFNTETHRQPVNEQKTINNNNPASGSDVSTEASSLAIEDLKTVQNDVGEPKISTKSYPNENPSASTTQKPINMNTERPTTIKNKLVTVTDVATEKASVSDTGTRGLTKPIKEEENLMFVVTEQPMTNKNLATDNDATAEKASVAIVENPNELTTNTPNHPVTEPLTVNDNSTDTRIDTESQKTIYTSTEQPITSTQSLATSNNSITENPSGFNTKTHKPPVTEQAKINDNSPATGSDVSTEASILATEDLKTVQNAVEEPKMSTKSYSTENHSASTTQKSINMNTERLNATKNELVTDIDVATEKASVPATGTHELTKPIIEEKNVILVVTEQPTTNKNLATDNDAIAEIASVTIVENPSGFTTKTPNHLVTEPLTVNENSLVTSIDATADGRVLSTEFQKSIYTSTDKSIISTKSYPNENPSASTTQKPINMNTERPTTIKNELVTVTDVATEKASVSGTGTHGLTKPIKEEENLMFVVTEQPMTNKNLATDNDATAEKASVAIVENPNELTTNTPNHPVTEQLTVNDNSTDTRIDTESQKPIYTSNEQSITSTQSLATSNNSITENPSGFNTKTHKPPVTEQAKINDNSPATGSDVSTEASILATEDLKTVQNAVEEPKMSTKSYSTENHSASTTQKSINMNTERLNATKNELVTDIDVATEKASVPATGTHELTKPIIEEKNLISVVTEQPTTNKNLATDNDAIAEIASVTIVENPSRFTAKTSNYLRTEPLMVNENSTDTRIDAATDASVLPTDSQKPIYTSSEQSITITKSLAIDNNSITENPSEFNTKTHRQPVTEQPTINNNSPATGSDMSTETSILSTEHLKPVQNGVGQEKLGTKSYPTENPSPSTTQKAFNMNTERPTTIKNELVTDTDVATEKASVSVTGTHEVTKPIIEEKNLTLTVTEQPATNKNLATDNDATAEKASVEIAENPSEFTKKIPNNLVSEQLTVNENSSVTSTDAATDARVSQTESQKPIYTSLDQSIISTKSLATDKDVITEDYSAFKIETQNTIYMSSQQPTTYINRSANDIDVTTEKAIVSASDVITKTQNSISTSTEQPTTIKTDFATDIGLTTETAIVSPAATIRPTILIEDEVASALSDKYVETGQQQGSLTGAAIVRSPSATNTNHSAKITTDAMIVQSTGVTEQSIAIAAASEDNVEEGTKTLNVTKLRNKTTSNNEVTVTQVVELVSITTSEPTTRKIEDSDINLDITAVKEETVGIVNNTKTSDTDTVINVPVNNVQTIQITTQQLHQNTFDVTSGTVDSLIPIIAKIDVKKDEGTLTAESMYNFSNGQQEITLSTHKYKTDLTNGVTTDTSLNIENEINIPVTDSASLINSNAKYGTTSTFGITEVNIRRIVENIANNQQTTESNLKDTGIESITKSSTIHNVDGFDVGISNADTVSSVVNNTERVNLIAAEEVGEHIAKQLPAPVTEYLGKDPNTNLNGVNYSLDTNLQEDINNYSKNSNLAYSEQTFGADTTSETTATDKFTSSFNPTYKNSQQNILTSRNQLTTENTNIVIDNAAEGASTTLKDKNVDLSVLLTENGKNNRTLTIYNTPDTQDNSYVEMKTDKSMSSHDNVAKNLDALSKIKDNATQKTVQLSTQTDDFTSSPVQNVNNDVTIRKLIAEKSTTSGDVDFELHILNKNEIVQEVETTTQVEDDVQPTPTIAPIQNGNANNFISNPLSNILLDKINQAVNIATQNSASFLTNDRKINSMDILSTATVSFMDDSSTQLPRVQNTNDVTYQSSISSVQTNNNLPLSRLDNPSAKDDLQKTSQVASLMVTENPSVIQPRSTTPKETSVPKEEIFTNDRDDATPLITLKKSTTEFSILQGVQNLYNTIGNYFNTPPETSTSRNINIDTNGDISSIHSTHDFQDSSKTSTNIYNTVSSVIGKDDNFTISKLGSITTISNLPSSVIYNGDNPKTTQIEMSTETSTNNVASDTILKKSEILGTFPEPNYNTDINTANVNQQTTNKPNGIVTSKTKISKEPYNSTSNPYEVVISAINTYQYGTAESDGTTFYKSIGTTVNTLRDVSQEPSPAGNKTTVDTEYKNVSQSTVSESSSVVRNAANAQNYSIILTDSAINSSKIAEKVGLVTNTTEAKNNEIIKNILKNNISIGSWKTYTEKNIAVIDTVSTNVSQGINKYGSTSTPSSTNTVKSNTQGDLKPQQKLSTNSISQVAEPVKPISPKHEIIHPVTITTQAVTAKITPRPVVPTTTTTTETTSKQNPKTASIDYSCINGIRGRYSDKDDCRKFYICIGNSQPIVGNCPSNTVFSDISKLCTKNLSHCIRENEFKCPSAGRFSDAIKDNVYYICVSHKNYLYRFKFQCQKGFTLNKAAIRCIENKEIESNESASISLSENSSDRSISSQSSSSSSSNTSGSNSSGSSSMSIGSDSSGSSSSSDSSSSDSSNNSYSSTLKIKNKKETKEKKESEEKPEGKDGDEEDEVFECEEEGKFPVRNDCRRYYLCKKNGKSEYRRKIKKCESGDVFHKDKKNSENSNESNDSENDSDRHHSYRRQRKEKTEEPENKKNYKQEAFKCEREGKFSIPGDCRQYYLCKRNRKSEYRRKVKKCDSDEVFHKSKKKCVDAESYEC